MISKANPMCMNCMYSYKMQSVLFCRRYPPGVQIIATQSKVGGQGLQPISEFPIMLNSNWCGEYQPQKEVTQ